MRNQRDEPSKSFTITNRTDDPTIDCNAAVAVIGDGLGTLIEELQARGIVGGTTA